MYSAIIKFSTLIFWPLLLHFFELGPQGRYLDLVLLELVLRHFQIVEQFVVLALVLVKLLHVIVQRLEDANLDELL